jgi:hypothetical protein
LRRIIHEQLPPREHFEVALTLCSEPKALAGSFEVRRSSAAFGVLGGGASFKAQMTMAPSIALY